jgi:hypothetical protein
MRLSVRSLKVPHENFAEGFIVGFQLVQGVDAEAPEVPARPATPRGMSPFLLGVRMGIQAAGAEIYRS